MKPILRKYFYSFVSIYCGELQDNVTDSVLHDLPEIKLVLSDLFEKITSVQEHPPIWGPGLIEPPGGPDYRNR